MTSLKKYLLLLLFSTIFISNICANIVQKMINENYSEIIRPFVSKWYVGTLYMENNKLKIIYQSDFGRYPTIMAYNITDNKIEIILKCLPLRNIPMENEIFSPLYYLLTLSLEDDNINYVCHYIENPYLIIRLV